jgi:hypothetical protein
MGNLSSGFVRLTWVVSIILAIPAVFFEVANMYQRDPRLAASMFLLAVFCCVFPWLVFFVVGWVARGFSSKEYLPIVHRKTGG